MQEIKDLITELHEKIAVSDIEDTTQIEDTLHKLINKVEEKTQYIDSLSDQLSSSLEYCEELNS